MKLTQPQIKALRYAADNPTIMGTQVEAGRDDAIATLANFGKRSAQESRATPATMHHEQVTRLTSEVGMVHSHVSTACDEAIGELNELKDLLADDVEQAKRSLTRVVETSNKVLDVAGGFKDMVHSMKAERAKSVTGRA